MNAWQPQSVVLVVLVVMVSEERSSEGCEADGNDLA